MRIACGAVLATGLVLTAAGGRQHAHGAFIADGAGAFKIVDLARRALSAASPVAVAARRRRRHLLNARAILGLIAVVAGIDTILCTNTTTMNDPRDKSSSRGIVAPLGEEKATDRHLGILNH